MLRTVHNGEPVVLAQETGNRRLEWLDPGSHDLRGWSWQNQRERTPNTTRSKAVTKGPPALREHGRRPWAQW